MQKQVQVFRKDVLRYPRLDTVLMIEKAIQKAKGNMKITRIWQALPKKVMWQTFVTTLDYLIYSGKILVEKDKTIVWIWNPKLIKLVRKQGVEA